MTLHSEAVKEIDLEALRAALAAGPTPGPWTAHVTTREVEVTAPCGRAIYVAGANTDSESIPDAEWIAAANPHVIGALVAELTARRARDAEVGALVEKGIALIDRYQRDDEDVISRFERLAAMFQSDTGFMAPGKDTSAAAYAGEEYERQREDCWNAWCLEPIKRFRAALLPFQRSDDKGDAT